MAPHSLIVGMACPSQSAYADSASFQGSTPDESTRFMQHWGIDVTESRPAASVPRALERCMVDHACRRLHCSRAVAQRFSRLERYIDRTQHAGRALPDLGALGALDNNASGEARPTSGGGRRLAFRP